jgi:hypothetical protein
MTMVYLDFFWGLSLLSPTPTLVGQKELGVSNLTSTCLGLNSIAAWLANSISASFRYA